MEASVSAFRRKEGLPWYIPEEWNDPEGVEEAEFRPGTARKIESERFSSRIFPKIFSRESPLLGRNILEKNPFFPREK